MLRGPGKTTKDRASLDVAVHEKFGKRREQLTREHLKTCQPARTVPDRRERLARMKTPRHLKTGLEVPKALDPREQRTAEKPSLKRMKPCLEVCAIHVPVVHFPKIGNG